ncbi:MAG: multicopper oxidase domain-containing protein, partial [Longimicrobiales bacterium]|nr:multicopper oxidase domain-containing protein [Longimicrobiales bacterium]
TRFDDYTGTWVHHCHILLHEDMGMMQAMECIDDPAQVNYRVRAEPARHDMSGDEVSRIYPPPSAEVRYRQNLGFVDANELGGQTYPGFDLEVPTLQE